MLFKSQLITQASGSVGGLTYSHNSGGLYTRARSIPTNPNSPQQATVRANMGALVNRWNAVLTDAQRDAWYVYAANVTVTNRLGDQVTISGPAHYTRSNQPRLQAGLSAIDDAPEVFNLGETGIVTGPVDAAADEIDVTFGGGETWVNTDGDLLLVWCSRPQNNTVNFFKGPYRFAGSIAGDATTPPTSPTAIALPFAAAAGNKVFFRTRVTRADGRLSDSFRGVGIAA